MIDDDDHDSEQTHRYALSRRAHFVSSTEHGACHLLSPTNGIVDAGEGDAASHRLGILNAKPASERCALEDWTRKASTMPFLYIINIVLLQWATGKKRLGCFRFRVHAFA
jgi:hypothetical protein